MLILVTGTWQVIPTVLRMQNKITDPIWKRAFNVIANCNNLIQQVETRIQRFSLTGKWNGISVGGSFGDACVDAF